MAGQLLAKPGQLGDGFWLIEPVGVPVPLVGAEDEATVESEAVATAR